MFYDAHTHLNDDRLWDNREHYLQNFISNGGKGLVNIGVSTERNNRAIEIAKISSSKYDIFCKASVGFHPSEVIEKNINKSDFKIKIQKLKDMYKDNKEYIVGIGECGIDMHYEGAYEVLGDQKEFLAMHADLAQELGLGLIVHSRDGFEQTMDVLKNYRDLKIYMHCRGYGPEEVVKIFDMFDQCYIGYAGNVTYPKAVNIKESMLITPWENMLMETDAPYLSPQKIRGSVNESTNIKYIYEYVSENRFKNAGYLYKIFEENFLAMYS